MEFHYGWVGVIISILIHTTAMIWWAATITQKVNNLEKLMSRMEIDIEKIDDRIMAVCNRIERFLATFHTSKNGED